MGTGQFFGLVTVGFALYASVGGWLAMLLSAYVFETYGILGNISYVQGFGLYVLIFAFAFMVSSPGVSSSS